MSGDEAGALGGTGIQRDSNHAKELDRHHPGNGFQAEGAGGVCVDGE